MHSVIIIGSDRDSLVLKESLKKGGFKAFHAANRKSGLGKAREKRPDLILLNAGKNNYDIFDTIREIKADSLLKDIITFVLSEISDEFDIVMALELGADDYIIKPSSTVEITTKLKSRLKYKFQKPF